MAWVVNNVQGFYVLSLCQGDDGIGKFLDLRSAEKAARILNKKKKRTEKDKEFLKEHGLSCLG